MEMQWFIINEPSHYHQFLNDARAGPLLHAAHHHLQQHGGLNGLHTIALHLDHQSEL
jgi:hypothetical protein